ncbi:MAG: hypothetical protein ACI83B_000168 [Sediminicola sp.]|jgi:hypothetical protein
MKKIIILIGIVLTYSFFGCSDFLDNEPYSEFAPDNLYESKSGINAGIIGLYDNLNGWPSLYQWNAWQLRESLTEYSTPDPASVDPSRIGQNDLDNQIWALRANWSWFYKIIASSNALLVASNNIEFNGKEELLAEVKFMRAYAYFGIVRFFGPAVLVTEPFDPSLEPSGVSDEADIYSLIAEDLDYAMQYLPLNSVNAGRANRWVAKAMAAQFYLTRAGNPINGGVPDYTKARDLAKEVITSGPYALVNYDQVFRVNGNQEVLWAVKNRITGNENHFGFICFPRNGSGLSVFGEAVGLPTASFINSFPNGDFRRQWGIRTQINVKGTLETSNVPFYAKFLDEDNLSTTANVFGFGLDVPIIRLADLYLIAAEAENEVNGPTSDAYLWANTVRARARINPLDITHVPNFTGLDQVSFREQIFRERRRELFFEGDGWFDLKRLNRFNLISTERSQYPLVNPTIGNWPIPDFETDNNPNIVPGN